MAFADGGEELELMRVALGIKEAATTVEVLTEMDKMAQEIGILRDAAKGKGNFGLGERQLRHNLIYWVKHGWERGISYCE